MQEQDNLPQEKQSWLKEIAEKSWEPELLVSGAAIYLTSNLPTWIGGVENYYTIHFLTDVTSSIGILPMAAFGFLKLISYLLLCAFVSHFTLRAFWVATVGLSSVYPQDINYENLTTYTDYFKEQLKKRFGTLQDYIDDLDKTCSSLLSIAFSIAITLLGISRTYVIGFAIIQLIGWFVPDEYSKQFETITFIVFFVVIVCIGLAGVVLNLPQLKNKPEVQKVQFKMYVAINNFFIPFMSHALQHISFIFSSNISKKKYYTAIITVLFLMVSLLPFTMGSGVLAEYFLETRDFYSNASAKNRIDSDFYEDTRNAEEAILRATIPSQSIEGKSLKIFLSYPKRLDKEMRKVCAEINVADSMPKSQADELKDAHALACLDKFFTISINDSVYSKEMIFYKHHVTKELGLLTYLPTKNFKEGKNVVKVERIHSDTTRKDRNTFIIPFWYVKD